MKAVTHQYMQTLKARWGPPRWYLKGWSSPAARRQNTSEDWRQDLSIESMQNSMEVDVSLNSSPTRSSWPCLGRSGTLRVKMKDLNLHILLDSGPRKKAHPFLLRIVLPPYLKMGQKLLPCKAVCTHPYNLPHLPL